MAKYENNDKSLIGPRVPYIVGQVAEDSKAESVGMMNGDQVIELNGQPIAFFHELYEAMKDRANQEITVMAIRNENDTLSFQTTLGEDGMFGISPDVEMAKYFPIQVQKYSLGQSIPMGFNMSYNFVASQVKAFGKMFSGKLKVQDSLGSIISIGKLYGSTWVWEKFWRLTAMLSLLLAFLNPCQCNQCL